MSDDDDAVVTATEGTATSDLRESKSKSSPVRIRWCHSRFWLDITATCRCHPSFRAVDTIYKTDGSLEVKIIDVAASFSPPSSQNGPGSTWTKLAIVFWKLVVIASEWYAFTVEFFLPWSAFAFAYLTNWGLMFSMVYSLFSLANTLFPIENREEDKQTSVNEGIVPLRARLTWAFFDLAAWLELVLTVVYWVLIYEGTREELSAYNVLAHGIVMALIWIDGLVVNRIPVRMRHWLEIGVPFLVLYTTWTVLQGVVLGIPNPDYDYHSIYPILDWAESPLFSSGLVAGLILVWSPFVYVLMLGASLLGRRYVDGGSATADASNKSASKQGFADEGNPV